MSLKRSHQDTLECDTDKVRWSYHDLLQSLATRHQKTRPTFRRALHFVVNALHLVPSAFDLPGQCHPASEYALILLCNLLAVLLRHCKYLLTDLHKGGSTAPAGSVAYSNLVRYMLVQCQGLKPTQKQWTEHSFIQLLHDSRVQMIDEALLWANFQSFCDEYLTPDALKYFQANPLLLLPNHYPAGLAPCCRVIPDFFYWASPYPRCSYEMALNSVVMSHYLKTKTPMALHCIDYYDECFTVYDEYFYTNSTEIVPSVVLKVCVYTYEKCYVKAPDFITQINSVKVALMPLVEHQQQVQKQYAQLLSHLMDYLPKDVAKVVLRFLPSVVDYLPKDVAKVVSRSVVHK